MGSSFYDISATDIDGNDTSMRAYEGKVLLIVNVASKCGFTPQYDGLQTLYETLKGEGLEILAFPCNQFMGQEPEDEVKIKEFCTLNFHVQFPMFGKIDVNGEHTHPLFKKLKENAPGLLGSKSIKWNFTKFLVDREGKVVGRYSPKTKPEEIREDVERLL